MKPTGQPPTDAVPDGRIVGVEVAQFLALVEVLAEVGPEAAITLGKDGAGELHAEITDPGRLGAIRVVVDIDAHVRPAGAKRPAPAPVIVGGLPVSRWDGGDQQQGGRR